MEILRRQTEPAAQRRARAQHRGYKHYRTQESTYAVHSGATIAASTCSSSMAGHSTAVGLVDVMANSTTVLLRKSEMR